MSCCETPDTEALEQLLCDYELRYDIDDHGIVSIRAEDLSELIHLVIRETRTVDGPSIETATFRQRLRYLVFGHV